ncbi:MAG: chemotaxis protein CheW [Kofleriaceae bacterium]|nr:chemotaxis protein CheW [Kofleriaceae bacterium]
MTIIHDEQQSMSAAALSNASTPAVVAASADYLVYQGRAALMAIAAEQIVEIVPRAVISRLPWAPRYVAGVCAVRGRVVPVLQLDDAVRGDLLAVATMALPRMVIAQTNDMEFGLLAEHTFGLYAFSNEDFVMTQGGVCSARTTWRGATLHVLDAAAIAAIVRSST